MRSYLSVAAIALAAAAVPAASNAAVVINVNQVGANVVSTLSGSLDLTGLAFSFNASNNTGIRGTPAFTGFGTPGTSLSGYTGFAGPIAIGPNSGLFSAASSSGSDFAFNAGSFGAPVVFVAGRYVSGDALAGSSLYANQTLASIGLTTGTYVYRSAGDTLTINVGPGVPEPATWTMMIAGFGLVGGALRGRTRGARLPRLA